MKQHIGNKVLLVVGTFAVILLVWVGFSLVVSRGKVFFGRGVKLKVTRTIRPEEPVPPLLSALWQSRSLGEFEVAVRSNRSLINSNFSAGGPTILAVCAWSGMTNHVQVLLAYGADTALAMQYLSDVHDTQAINLLEYCVKTSTNRQSFE